MTLIRGRFLCRSSPLTWIPKSGWCWGPWNLHYPPQPQGRLLYMVPDSCLGRSWTRLRGHTLAFLWERLNDHIRPKLGTSDSLKTFYYYNGSLPKKPHLKTSDEFNRRSPHLPHVEHFWLEKKEPGLRVPSSSSLQVCSLALPVLCSVFQSSCLPFFEELTSRPGLNSGFCVGQRASHLVIGELASALPHDGRNLH